MAEVSVIVPVYNCERWVGECIDSIIAQSYSDWELILIDDGSTDGSSTMCEEYAAKDRRIKCFHQKNAGLSASRNRGLDLSSGKYVMFVDGDDCLHPQAIETLFNHIRATDLQIVSARAIYTPDYKFPPSLANGVLRVVAAERLIKDILYQKRGTDNSVCWKLFDKKLFDHDRFRKGWFEDLDIFYRLYLNAGKVGLSDDIIYFYRKHDDSFINNWSEGRRDILDVINRMDAYLSAGMTGFENAVAHRRFSANYNIFNALCRTRCDNNQLAQQCFSTLRRYALQIAKDRHSRLKNRIGALAVMSGYNLTKKLALWASKY